MKSTNQPKTHRKGGYTTKQSAFTLIELLVVIAIIGILASVVIASLNSARTKGRHAAIKANLRNAVSQTQIYFNDNGTYYVSSSNNLCTDPKIQEIVAVLGGSGSASCYVSSSTLKDLDFGIATTFDGIHFTADPSGVLQLDATDTGGTQTWDTAMASCASAGKRMPGGSSLKALYNITASTPSGLTAGTYWSSTPHPTYAADAYVASMSNGSFGYNDRSNARYVRCGS